MYRVHFHNADPKRILYIFKIENGVVQSSTGDYQWTDVKGDSVPVMLRFDELEENGVFTPIVKTSLQVRLKRLNEQDYMDIIDSEDNLWMAVVLQNAELSLDYDYTPLIVYDEEVEGENLLFKGLLTLETYGENFTPYADVVLTFHDRLGDLQDLEFDPKEAVLPITTILANCLYSCTCSKRLYLEFPYDVQFTREVLTEELTYENLKTPSNYLIDVTSYCSKKAYEVLTDILISHGLRLHCDFNAHSDNILMNYGAIRVEYVGNLKNATFDFYNFDMTLEESSEFSFYDYVNSENSSGGVVAPIEETRTIIDMDTPTLYPIKDLGGNWELTRKAKSIKGTSVFQQRENLVFPEEFLLEDFTYVGETEYELEYRMWGPKGVSPTPPYGYFYQKANRVGNLLKLGLLVDDHTSYTNLTTGLMVPNFKGILFSKITGVTFSITAQLWANMVMTYYIAVKAIDSDGNVYYYNPNTGLWEGIIINATLTMLTVVGEYTDYTITDIPLPEDISENEVFNVYLIVYRDVFTTTPTNEGEMTYLTEITVTAQTDLDVYPSKITINTVLGETRRKSVEFDVNVYNLPTIDEASLLFYNGIYAKGLDVIKNSSIVEETSSKVVVLPTVVLNGNAATLLVHLTDTFGLQYLWDRWKFDCTLLELPNNTFQEILFFTEEFTDAFVDGIPDGWTLYSTAGSPVLTQVDSTYMQVDVGSGDSLYIQKTYSERYGRIRVEIKCKKVLSGLQFSCMLLLQNGWYELLQFYTSSSEIVFTDYVDVLQSNPVIGFRFAFSATNVFLIDYVHLTKTS